MAIKNITVPDVGASDVVVIEVLVKVGDHIKADTSLITLESDKATMEVPSTDEGVVKEVKVKVGDKVSMGSVILTVETAGAEKSAPAVTSAPKVAAPATPAPAPIEPAAALTTKPAEPQTGTVISAYTADVHAGPAVRKLAREFGVDLAQVSGTGPKQRILKEDVQLFVKSRLSQVATTNGAGLPTAPAVDFTKFGPVVTEPLSRIKKLSGKNLHRNWLLVPHVTQDFLHPVYKNLNLIIACRLKVI